MAEEKTEEATPERLRQARQEGNIVRSTEMTQALGLLGSVAVLAGGAHLLAGRLLDHLRTTLGHLNTDPMQMASQACTSVLWILFVSLPLVMLAGAGGGAIGHLLVGGLNFTTHSLKFDVNKLNPLPAVQKWFSPKMLVEIVRMSLKAGVLGYLAYSFFMQQLLPLAAQPAPMGALETWLPLVVGFTWRIVGAQIAIGVLDWLYQRWEYKRGLRMSKYDLKQEYKSQEGDPHAKAKRKQLARKIAKSMKLDGIKEARVLICNPTHYAVAIAYDFTMPAPKVVAKGADNVAMRLKKMARKLNVPIVEEPPLARALFKLELDDTVPLELYRAVAEVLISVTRAEDYL